MGCILQGVGDQQGPLLHLALMLHLALVFLCLAGCELFAAGWLTDLARQWVPMGPWGWLCSVQGCWWYLLGMNGCIWWGLVVYQINC